MSQNTRRFEEILKEDTKLSEKVLQVKDVLSQQCMPDTKKFLLASAGKDEGL